MNSKGEERISRHIFIILNLLKLRSILELVLKLCTATEFYISKELVQVILDLWPVA